MKKNITKTLALIATLCGLNAFGDILTEQPYYWYKFDSTHNASSGSANLGSFSVRDANINTVSPWGRALSLTQAGNGPYGGSFALPTGDWTYHVRAKLPANLDKGVIWCIGNWNSDKYALLLLTRANDAGLSLATANAKKLVTKQDIDCAGLSSAYHDITAVYSSSAKTVQLYVDGVAKGDAFSYTSFTVSKPWQWLAPYGGLSSGGAVNYGTDTYLEEFRFYQKALTTTEIAELHDSVVTLQEDTTGLTGLAGKVVDLNGHKLTTTTLVGPNVILDTSTGTPGQLIVNVAEGDTLENPDVSINGNLKFVKEGAGTFLGKAQNQCYTGGTVVNAGTIKSSGGEILYYYGSADTPFTINANGTLDMAGKYNWYVHPITLNGGTIRNTGDNQTTYTSEGIGNLTLTADSTMSLLKHTLINHPDTKVNLGGHKLTVVHESGTTDALLTFTNTKVYNGTIDLGKDIRFYPYGSTPDFTDVTVVMAGSCRLTGDQVFSNLVSNLNKADSQYTAAKKITVKGTFKPVSQYLHNTVLANGATLDLTDKTEPFDVNESLIANQTISFAEGGTVTVDIHGRDLAIGTQVLAWSAKPDGVAFQWDETTATKGVALVANDKGIYYGKVVVSATWTNALGDGDITKPGNWTCYDDESQVIEGGVPSSTSNITIGDGKSIVLPLTDREGSFTLGEGATLTIDLGEGRYIEGTALLTTSVGTISIANGTVTTTKGGSAELSPDAKQLRYMPPKVMVARWDFNNYNPETPKSPDVLAATKGEAGVPCYHESAGSEEIADLGDMSVVNTGLEAGNYAISIPLHYHVKLPLPKTLQRGDWTIRMRFYTPTESMGVMRTFFSRDNTADGDLFINKDNKVGGGGKITPSGKYYGAALAADAWHLLTVSQRNGYGAVCVDGEQSYTWTDGSKWNFFFDKDYLYLCADNSGEDNLLFVDYIELDVEPPAHDSTAIVDGVLTRDVVLTNDQDWSAIAISSLNNKTIDLAGHSLTISSAAGTGRALDTTTDAENPGSLVVNVAEGATYTNGGLALAGNLKLVKEGAGTFVPSVKAQTYTGGTVVNAGIIKASSAEYDGSNGNRLGANDTDITVNAGGTFDINGKFKWSNHDFVLNGGILANYGAFMNGYSTDNGHGIHDIRLEADSFVEVANGTVFGHSDAVIDLNGHTLTVSHVDTKSSYACLYVRSTIQNGTFHFGSKVQLWTIYDNVCGENLTLESQGDFRRDSTSQTLMNLVDASENANAATGSGIFTVTNSFKPVTQNFQNTKLANGATLDLMGKTGEWLMASAISGQTFTFAEGTITVDLSGRTLAKGDRIIRWSAVPQGVTFQWDSETAEAGIAPSADEYGLFYGGTRFTVDINNGGTFTIPSSVPDEELDGVRLFYAGGAPVNNPKRDGRTITFDWDITDGACWWDYEFNGNVTSTGADTTTMTAEGTTPYYNDANTALWVGHSTHYRSVSAYPEEFTAVMYGKIVNHEKHIEVGFGSRSKDSTSKISVSLACGDPTAEEVQLLIADGTTVKKVVSMSVPNAYTADHLYAFVCKTITENETEKTKVLVYLDGVEWDSYTFDGKIVLGQGFQIGSIHGGILSGYSKATTANENSFLDFLRTYNVALNGAAMTSYAKKYPYKSTNGNASRTFSGEGVWAVQEGKPWSVTPAVGEGFTTNIPPAKALLTIDAAAAATVTMNLDEAATYEQLKVQGNNAITLKAGGTVIPTVTGLTSVGADLTVDYNAIGIGKVMVSEDKTLTFDFTDFPFGNYFKGATNEFTGAVSGAGTVAAIIPDLTGTGRTATFGLNEYGHYALVITVDTSAHPFVYTIDEGAETGVWTWGNDRTDEATVLAQSSATIKKAGTGTQQFVGVSKFAYEVAAGTLMFTNDVDGVTSTITINTGATFDMNGNPNAKYNIVLSGGSLVNNGADLKTNQRQINTLVLTADSTIGGTGNFDFIRDGHGASVLDLGGFTLTKTGDNDFWYDNGVVSNGTVIANGGRFCIGMSNGSGEHKFVDATIEIGASGKVYVSNHDVTISEITGTAGAVLDSNGGKLIGCTLTGSMRLDDVRLCDAANPLTLAEGATVQIGTLRDFVFADQGTVDVKLTAAEYQPGKVITAFTRAQDATTTVGKVFDPEGNDVTYQAKIDGNAITMKKEATNGTIYYFTLKDAIEQQTGAATIEMIADVTDEQTIEVGQNLVLEGGTNILENVTFSGDGTLTLNTGCIGIAHSGNTTAGGCCRFSEDATNSWAAYVPSGYKVATLSGTVRTGYDYEFVPEKFVPASGEQLVPVADAKGNDAGAIKLDSKWVADKTGETDPQKQAEALNTQEDNGMMKWQNDILGLTGAESTSIPVVATPQQTAPVGYIDFKMGGCEVDTTSGATVKYKVLTAATPGAEVWSQTGGISNYTETVRVELPDSGVKYYKLEVIPETSESVKEEPKAPQVTINGKGYPSLAAAIGDAEAGDTLVVLGDLETGADVNVAKDMTIDMNELTVAGMLNVKSGATLTVCGVGEFDGPITVEQGGKLDFKNGKHIS